MCMLSLLAASAEGAVGWPALYPDWWHLELGLGMSVVEAS